MGSDAGSVALAGSSRRAQPPGLVWDSSAAVLGAVYALPGGVIVLSDRSRGLALAVGVLPARDRGSDADARVVGTRGRRARHVDRLADVRRRPFSGRPGYRGPRDMPGSGVGSALLAARFRLGQVAMTLSLPMVGVSGSAIPVLVRSRNLQGSWCSGRSSPAWSPCSGTEHAAAPSAGAGPRPTLGYGLRLGAAGATAAAIGFLLDLEHVGWACAAALLVMRPAAEMQRLRSVGRIAAVAIGALAAIGLVRLNPHRRGRTAWPPSPRWRAPAVTYRSQLVRDPGVHHIPGVIAPVKKRVLRTRRRASTNASWKPCSA